MFLFATHLYSIKAVDATHMFLDVPEVVTIGSYDTTVTVHATIYPVKATSQVVEFEFEPINSAIEENGVIKLTGESDEVYVKVKSMTEGIYSSFKIIVDSNQKDLESIHFNTQTLNLLVNQTINIHDYLEFSHVNHGSIIYFESSNPEVVSIDKLDGIVHTYHTTTGAPIIITAKSPINESITTISVYVGAPINGIESKQEIYYLLENSGLNGYFDISKEINLISSHPGVRPTGSIDNYSISEVSEGHAFVLNENGVLDYTMAKKGDEITVSVSAGDYTTSLCFIVTDEFKHLKSLSGLKRIVLEVGEHYYFNTDLKYQPIDASLPLHLDYLVEDETILFLSGTEGYIQGISVGQTTFTYLDKQSNLSFTMDVTVIDSFPEQIELISRSKVLEVGDESAIEVNAIGGYFTYDERYFELIDSLEAKDHTVINLKAIQVGETDVAHQINYNKYANNYTIVKKRDKTILDIPNLLPGTGTIKLLGMIGLTLLGVGTIIYINKNGDNNEA